MKAIVLQNLGLQSRAVIHIRTPSAQVVLKDRNASA